MFIARTTLAVTQTDSGYSMSIVEKTTQRSSKLGENNQNSFDQSKNSKNAPSKGTQMTGPEIQDPEQMPEVLRTKVIIGCFVGITLVCAIILIIFYKVTLAC